MSWGLPELPDTIELDSANGVVTGDDARARQRPWAGATLLFTRVTLLIFTCLWSFPSTYKPPASANPSRPSSPTDSHRTAVARIVGDGAINDCTTCAGRIGQQI